MGWTMDALDAMLYSLVLAMLMSDLGMSKTTGGSLGTLTYTRLNLCATEGLDRCQNSIDWVNHNLLWFCGSLSGQLHDHDC